MLSVQTTCYANPSAFFCFQYSLLIFKLQADWEKYEKKF
nr:MAG TPA: hypothetical protein [Caudoviricetes sp.]